MAVAVAAPVAVAAREVIKQTLRSRYPLAQQPSPWGPEALAVLRRQQVQTESIQFSHQSRQLAVALVAALIPRQLAEAPAAAAGLLRAGVVRAAQQAKAMLAETIHL